MKTQLDIISEYINKNIKLSKTISCYYLVKHIKSIYLELLNTDHVDKQLGICYIASKIIEAQLGDPISYARMNCDLGILNLDTNITSHFEHIRCSMYNTRIDYLDDLLKKYKRKKVLLTVKDDEIVICE